MSLITSTGGFIPTPENLQNACELLTISRNPMDARYREASQNLENLMIQGEFVVHLSYIFARLTPEHIPDDVRQLAGLVLKQGITIAPLKSLAEDVQQYVKSELLVALSDRHSEMVRKTAGSVITALASKTRIAGGLAGWPSLMPSLFELLDPALVSTPEGMLGAGGSLSCLSKICEDYGWCMDEQTVQTLIPRLLPFFNCGDVDCRLSSVLAMQYIVSGVFNQSASINIDGYLQAYLTGLSALTSDAHPAVRKAVCQSLIALFDCAPQYVIPVFPSVAEFMLHASQDGDSEVAIAAMDFWIPCCSCHLLAPGTDDEGMLIDLLPRLIAVLLQGMCYTEEEISEFESESSDDADTPDRPEDLRPIFHKMNGGKGSKKTKKAEVTSGEEEDDDDDEEDDDEVVGVYSLQKKSAATLDKASARFGDPLLPLVLPSLVERLGSGSVWVQVAAVLAFGALQSGSAAGVEEYLPQLFPFMLEHLENANSKMREMCCWTIGRCMSWAVNKAWVGPQGGEVLDPSQLQPITHKLLARISDRNKKVQQYACSTFAIFIEVCAEYGCLDVFAPPQTSAILECLFSALTNYKIKSTVIMLDTIGTFTEMLEDYFTDPSLSAMLLQPLMNFFQMTPDTDNLVFPLFECLSACAAATKLNFRDYALPVLVRCCTLIEQVLLLDSTGALDAQGEPANKQVIASCLDLIDGVVRGLEGNFGLLLQSTPCGGEELLKLLNPCLEDEEDEVRQAALGLVGDLAHHCAASLKVVAPSILSPVRESLSLTRGRKVCSNAAWALGELTVAFGDELIGGMADRLVLTLASLSDNDECHPNLLENIAGTIGRLSLSSAARVGPHVESFIDNWLLALHEVAGEDTREQAFRGLICLAQVAWDSVVAQRYYEFLRAVASWTYFDDPPDDMKAAFQQIITQASVQMQGSVDPSQYLGAMDEDYRNYLVHEFSF